MHNEVSVFLSPVEMCQMKGIDYGEHTHNGLVSPLFKKNMAGKNTQNFEERPVFNAC